MRTGALGGGLVRRRPGLPEGGMRGVDASRPGGPVMGDDSEAVWAGLPENVDHPYRVAIIEALLWICEPLSAVGVVDVLDGYMSMWNAVAHLEALGRLGVVEPVAGTGTMQAGEERFDMAYRLVPRGTGGDG